MNRVAVVLHPKREVAAAVQLIGHWAAERGFEMAQLTAEEGRHGVSSDGRLAACDLVVAVGGDGTTLTALHVAAEMNTPVLGVAYGSLGALSTVPANGLREGLDRFAAGDWTPRRLSALTVDPGEGRSVRAINDLVLARRGSGQVVVALSVEGDLYARMAGDGLVIATPLGSSAYSMAAGGPLLLARSEEFVCTPLAMHGGCAPPLVVAHDGEVHVDVDPGYWGFDVEVDGHRVVTSSTRFAVGLQPGYTTLVEFDRAGTGLVPLRARGLVADSPRVLARDAEGHPKVAPART